RLLLQAGVGQLYTASVGVTAALVFLYGCARLLPRRAVPLGLLGGMALSVVAHVLLDRVDLVWRPGVWPWLVVVAVCAAFLYLLRQAPTAGTDLAPSRTWFLFGPSLFLVGWSATAWIDDALPSDWLLLGVVILAVLIMPLQVLMSNGGRTRAAVAGLAAVFFAGMLVAFDTFSVGAAFVLYAVGALIPASATAPAPAGRQGMAMLGGGVLFLVATFAYYSSYDLDLGFPNAFVVLAMLLLTIGVALLPVPPAETAPRLSNGRGTIVVIGAIAVSALVAFTQRPVEPPEQTKQGDTFKLITYNIRMGFGLDGRLSLDRIAAWAKAQHPDVVLLSEVDRGWFLNGGHDDLDRIAAGLGMRAHFAPAADQVWGDALLTNLPVKEITSHELGKHDYPTGAQAQTAVVEIGGRNVSILNTHLQAPVPQAPEVAALIKELEPPVVMAGDLNTRPTDPQMRVLLDAGLTDPLLELGNPSTSPADAPRERIDHVLIGPGLEAVSAEVPRLPYSDHLPIVATLRLT
ncbi:MAG: hypothetical protein HOY71_46585, partial [Nonomuraea sp.]|nr:hypothetical protein [Nonomuraea sp.]